MRGHSESAVLLTHVQWGASCEATASLSHTRLCRWGPEDWWRIGAYPILWFLFSSSLGNQPLTSHLRTVLCMVCGISFQEICCGTHTDLSPNHSEYLTLSNIKGQSSAIALLYQIPVAFLSLLKAFAQGVVHILPPVCPHVTSWNLSLVLSALQRLPFEPIRDISLSILYTRLPSLVPLPLRDTFLSWRPFLVENTFCST